MLLSASPKYKKRLEISVFLLLFAWLIVSSAVGAQTVNNTPNSASQLSGQIPEPPIGSGKSPVAEISGDTGTSPPPPTDQANTVPLPSGFGLINTTAMPVIHLYEQRTDSNGVNRGLREVQTLRPDQLQKLNSSQLSSLQQILGVSSFSGNSNISLQVSPSALENIQEIFAPYPGYTTETMNNKQYKKIVSDIPAQGYYQNDSSGENGGGVLDRAQSLYKYKGPLPTVRTFSRYLILLGVVMATVLMAHAAWAVVRGERDGGAKVVGVAAGLITLLMAYTIYKIDRMNMLNMNSTKVYANYNTDNPVPVIPGVGLTAASKAAVPTSERTQPQRSGVPLKPLGSANSQ